MERMEVDWDIASEVAKASETDRRTASKVISLLDGGNTLPFIARYRKEATGNMGPDSIRRIKANLTACREVIEKIDKAFKLLSSKGALSEEASKSLRQCRTLDEVSLITEPYVEKGPRTLAAKAIAAGLEPVALDVLKSGRLINFALAAGSYKVEKDAVGDISAGVSHIIAGIVAKDLNVLRLAEEICARQPPVLETTGCPASEPALFAKSARSKAKRPTPPDFAKNLKKFEKYFNFSRRIDHMAPHQILAINRAEEKKFIRVKLNFPQCLFCELRSLVATLYLSSVHPSHHKFVMDSFEDSWKRLLLPHITRKVRSKFTSLAHDLSLSVFSDNLRRLLMSAPLRCAPLPPAGAAATTTTTTKRVSSPTRLDCTSAPDVISAVLGSPGDRLPVVGLDPGWRHGCKWAACDPLGTVLQAGVLHITSTSGACPDSEMQLFARTMKSHGINTIGLGNGQACRQTERWLAQAVANGLFAPLRVRYTIVSECGASVYSASPLADRELPTLDVSLRGAVSIARRLQDPLAELVKIEPQHLGVGMYQHDLPPKRLAEAVNELMEECISFVGVDVNTAQQHVLARVAGLSDSKAKAIITYRSTNGRIRCRQELLRIKGIGQSTFSQCAGFLRVRPNYSNVPMDSSKDVEFISLCSDDDVEMEVISGKRRLRLISGTPAGPVKRKRGRATDSNELTFNPLDQTAIHPDSYDLATSLIRYLGYEISDVGCSTLRNAALVLYNSPNRDCTLAQFQTSEFGIETTRDILEALCRPLDFDERQDRFGPLFRSSITSMADLRPGLQVTGRVENVTTFGAFVDIGLEESAFLPLGAFPRADRGSKSAQHLSSSFVGQTDVTRMTLHLGDRVKATVSSIDVKWGRVALSQVSLL
ncbi:hypothetical protein AAHC03_0643 [Spirometra sp. Aus1]